jgi:uncharacterized protein
MLFEWDEKKNISNIKKHGIDFRKAVAAFYDEHKTLIIDNRNYNDEIREILIGKDNDNTFLLSVVYTERNNTYRIISARRASNKEKNMYYGYN